MTADTSPKPPKHLSPAARHLWRALANAFVLEPHHASVLARALEAYDRAEQARQVIDAEGLTVTSRFGEQKPHPLLSVERDARAAFLSAMKALNFDREPVTNRARTAAAREARWRS